MFAFLFDEDHGDMPGIYGPKCGSLVIEGLAGQSNTHLLQGSLLHSTLVYRVDEVAYQSAEKTNNELLTSTFSQSMVGDKNHFLTVICDLAETLATESPGMNEDQLLSVLGRKNLWLVVGTDLSWREAVLAHENCRQFLPYVGFVSVDRKNPVHRYLFAEVLFKGRYLAGDVLLFLNEEEEAGGFFEEYGAPQFELLGAEEFYNRVPPLELPEEVSSRGQLSSRRAAGQPRGYREKFAAELIKNQASSRDFKFSTRTPSLHEFEADEKKFRLYLLNRDHKKGGPKAKFFNEILGIYADDWRYLADQLTQGAAQATLYRVAVTQWEYGHGAVVRVTGRNGREALVETAWKLQDEGPASLVTAYPYDGQDVEVAPVQSRIPAHDLSGDALHQAIYNLAVARGIEAGSSATPTPMVLEKWGTIWEGLCGFAWVHLPNGRSPFARWLSRKDIGWPTKPGRKIYSSLPDQSIVKHEAFARAFAGVLLANGIECKVASRLD